MLTACPECNGKLSSTADKCPHCGYVPQAQQTCPECGHRVPVKLELCTGCGYPLAPRQAAPPPQPAPAPPPRRAFFGRHRSPRYRPEDPESPAALVFGILGLFVPVLSFIGFAFSRRGTAAQILCLIGMIWQVFAILFVMSLLMSARG